MSSPEKINPAKKAVETVVEKIVDKGLSFITSEVTRYRNVEKELERLRRTSARINSLLTDAEERRDIKDDLVKVWLRDLKSVSFSTDDLLDKYQTAFSVHKRRSNAGSSRKRKWYQMELGSDWGMFQRRRLALEIDEIDNRLEEIAKARKTLRLRGDDGPRTDLPHHRAPFVQSGPVHDPTIIIGRQNEKNYIVELLTSDQRPAGDSRPSVPVVPIHGAAGIGKTTLAQMICDDPRIHDHFDFQAWACLTDRCDVSTAMKEICEKMTVQRCDFQGLDRLLDHLRDYLKTREDNKFLLVIDNLWANDFYFWETLRIPLLAGGEGSKVVITTRNEGTFRIMPGLIPQPSLKGLDEEECWHLIKFLALPQGVTGCDNLVPIGMEIAGRCHGSPLAAKALGALLNARNEEEWHDVLSEMRALKDDKNGEVLTSLKISYHHLPYHLKQCFAYCSIFPHGYVFERDQVIRYWMAEGMIQPDGRRRLEAVGNKYFDELIWRSFFEKIPISDKSQVERYRMPSLMCDLGMLVSQYEFRSLEFGENLLEPKGGRPDQARYASLQPKNGKTVKLECLEPYSNLRTLKFCGECCDQEVPLNSILAPFFHKFTRLRVLDMSYSNLECVPDSVGELIHLRYLGLSYTKIITLPETICDLFNLQTLELKGCLKLARLPEGLGRLINLRHLDLHLDWEEIADSTEVVMPPGIGELENVQTLSRFNVTSNANSQDCNINELKNLDLRGNLCILNIERMPVSKPEEAMNANLQGKQFIESLMLRWHKSADNYPVQWQHSKKVMQYLRPHNRLRKLWVINYPGTNFPNWIGDASFSSLEMIRISNCNNFNFLPLLGHLPRLKNLRIDNVRAKTMDTSVGFLSLEHLILLNLPFLERLSLENEIPKLEKIYVSDCPDLKELVIHQNLHGKLESRNCPNLSISIHVPQSRQGQN